MILKIKITTPRGGASETAKKIKPFLLGFNQPKYFSVDKEDKVITWVIVGDPRRCLQIQKNVQLYDFFVKGILNNKMVKKALRNKLKPEQEEELKEMLLNGTKIEIV